jgi:hypothetical protein
LIDSFHSTIFGRRVRKTERSYRPLFQTYPFRILEENPEMIRWSQMCSLMTAKNESFRQQGEQKSTVSLKQKGRGTFKFLVILEFELRAL